MLFVSNVLELKTMNKFLTVLSLLGCFVLGWILISKRDESRQPQVNRPAILSEPLRIEPEVKPDFPVQSTYVGPWHTDKNRKLNGAMTCDVHYLGDHKWEGTFHGNWHGQDFSYDVKWEGPPENVKGTATVGGVGYTWTGSITLQTFIGKFDSRQYIGDFQLEKK